MDMQKSFLTDQEHEQNLVSAKDLKHNNENLEKAVEGTNNEASMQSHEAAFDGDATTKVEESNAIPKGLGDGDELVPDFPHDIKRTFKLFVPIFLGQIATSCMSVVDTVMAGMAGATQLAGVAIGASFSFPGILFIVGMCFAIQPTVAHLRGAGKSHLIPQKLHLATIVVLATSLIVGVIVCLLPLFYRLMPDIDQEMVYVGQWYIIAVAFGMPAFAIFNILRGYWEGLGNTGPTLVFGFVALFLNIPLNYIFIFGHLGLPAFGGIGCGIATSLTIYLTDVIIVIYLLKSKRYAKHRLYQKWFPISFKDVKEFLHFGFPLALSTTIEVTCFSLVAVLLSPFGPITVAAHSIAINIAGFVFMLPMSISAAATIRVGEAMGAHHWKRAHRASMSAYILGSFFYVITFLTLFFGAHGIVSLYTDDAQVIELGTVLLFYCIIFLLPDNFQVISIGILRGFKDSKTIFIFTILAYWVFGMPVGYTLCYGLITGEQMGAAGFWIGFICSLFAAGILYAFRIVYLFKTRKLPKTFILHDGVEH